MSMSVFDLDEKSESELLEIISAVISILDPRFARNEKSLKGSGARPQTPTTISIVQQRTSYYSSRTAISDFFTLVECPLPHLLRSRSELLSLLHWLLLNFSDLCKQSRIIRFCARTELPEAVRLGQDRELTELLNELEDLKGSIRVETGNLLGLESQKTEQDSIKRRSENHIHDAKTIFEKIEKLRRLNPNESSEKYLEVFNHVRQERMEKEKLKELSFKQETLKYEVDSLSAELADLCDEASMLTCCAPEQAAEALRTSTQKNQMNLEILEQDLIRIQSNCDELIRLKERFESVTPVQVAEAQRELKELQVQEDIVTKKLNNIKTPTMTLYYESREKFFAASSELDRVSLDHKRAMARKEADPSIVVNPSYECLQDEVVAVRKKGVEYKDLKRLVNELRAELFQLNHTIEVLFVGINLVDTNEKIFEGKKSLEETHAEFFQINSVKESQLEEMSRVVEQLVAKMNAKKAVLGPKLKELKSLRDHQDQIRDEIKQASLHAERQLESLSNDIEFRRNLVQNCIETRDRINESIKECAINLKKAEHEMVRAEEEERFMNGPARHSDLYKTHFEALTAVLGSRVNDCELLREKIVAMVPPGGKNHHRIDDRFEEVTQILERKLQEIQKFQKRNINQILLIQP